MYGWQGLEVLVTFYKVAKQRPQTKFKSDIFIKPLFIVSTFVDFGKQPRLPNPGLKFSQLVPK